MPAEFGSIGPLRYRFEGAISAPTLLYLPGVHGDWTPFAQARSRFTARFRVIELSYPQSAALEIPELAHSVRELLSSRGISSAHVLAESFGSLTGWELALRHTELTRSLIIVAGFSRGPAFVAHMARLGLSILPRPIFETGVDCYVAVRNAFGETRERPAADLAPYFAVRGVDGRLATLRRLHLIRTLDFRNELGAVSVPVRYLGGGRDLVVPVRREIRALESLLPRHADFRSLLLPRAPHMLLASHPDESTRAIISWIDEL